MSSLGTTRMINDEVIYDGLLQNIERAIRQSRSVLVTMSSSFSEIRNVIFIDDIDIEEDCLHISHDNFEMHIALNKCVIIYNDISDIERFVFKNADNNTETVLSFYWGSEIE